MGYYMRFFDEGEPQLTLAALDAELARLEPPLRLEEGGDLYRGTELLAEVEVAATGDTLFTEELAEFVELVDDADGNGKTDVLARLRRARSIVAVRVLWQGRTAEATLGLVQPLLDWLAASRIGLFQVDGEGFYDGDKLVLELA